MGVCISDRPAGTFVCAGVHVCETGRKRNTMHLNMHMCLCTVRVCVCVCVQIGTCMRFVWDEIVTNWVCNKACLGR